MKCVPSPDRTRERGKRVPLPLLTSFRRPRRHHRSGNNSEQARNRRQIRYKFQKTRTGINYVRQGNGSSSTKRIFGSERVEGTKGCRKQISGVRSVSTSTASERTHRSSPRRSRVSRNLQRSLIFRFFRSFGTLRTIDDLSIVKRNTVKFPLLFDEVRSAPQRSEVHDGPETLS